MIITPHSKNMYKLAESYMFQLDNVRFLIPKGFVSDGASIPNMFWKLIGTPFSPAYIEAAFVHDYLICTNYDGKSTDKYFLELLLKNGVNKIKANLMYAAVVLFRKYLEKKNLYNVTMLCIVVLLLATGIVKHDQIIQWGLSFFI